MPVPETSGEATSEPAARDSGPPTKIVYDLEADAPHTLPPQRGSEHKMLLWAIVAGVVLVGVALMLRDDRPPAKRLPVKTLPAAQQPPVAPPAPQPPVVITQPSDTPEPQATKAAAEQAAAKKAVEKLVAAAQASETDGDRARAVELYEQALVLAPTDAAVLSRLSLVYLNRGDNERAMTHAQRAVTADATSSEGWIVLGAARDATGDHKGAREAYRRCAEVGAGDYVTECKRMLR
jgi:hypothetical protein